MLTRRCGNVLAALLLSLGSCAAPLARARPDVDAALAALRSRELSGAGPIPSELVDSAWKRAPGDREAPEVGLLHTGSDALVARGHLFRAARQTIDLQVFTWASDEAGEFLFGEALRAARRGVRVRLLIDQMTASHVTNSLAATANTMVYGVSRKQRSRMLRLGLEIHEMKPLPEDVRHFCPRYEALLREAQGLGPEHDPYGDVPTEDLERGPQFAIHAKTLVVDGRVSLVCSHNFDPRSQALNTEAGVVIWSEDVAGELEQELRLLTSARNAWCVALKERVPVWSPINDFFTSISRALPILDVWPFRDYSNYDLREGCEPVPTDDARFREHYQAVGQFPGVSAGWKRFQTRLYSAFGGFLEGLL